MNWKEQLIAFILFCLGFPLKDFILGPNHAIWLDIVYYLILILVLHKFIYGCKQSPVKPNNDFTVCIVGAGFGGIGAAVKLKEIGVKFRIIEKFERLGGTWWTNQYPGCSSDVKTHLYR